MGNPLRHRGKEIVHHVCVKTFTNAITLVDYGQINDMIGGVVARYQEVLGIILYAICFNGNHFHMVVEAPNQNLDAFMQYVLREISRRMRRILPRHDHKPFWDKRYSDQIIPTNEDITEAYLYTTTNAVKHGLVETMTDYPGFSSFENQKNGGRPIVILHTLAKKIRTAVCKNETPIGYKSIEGS